jgi:hypothetical protein
MTKEQYIAAISKQRKIQAELNNIYMPGDRYVASRHQIIVKF